MALPSGRVTFVLTDIVGSTSLFRELGSRWPPLVRRHWDLLREAAASHGGVEVKTTGDGILLAFTDAAGAVAGTAAAQLALLREPWPRDATVRVRVGVHSGDAVPAGDDYIALPLHQTARLGDLAHGGQIVASEATRAAAAGRLPEGLSFHPLGMYDVRDFDDAVPLFQVLHPDLPDAFPPLRTAPSRRDNLPTRQRAIVGRDADAADARHLLAEYPIVTVCGTGGVGKTRLAIEIARMERPLHADGVWLVELAGANDEEGLLAAVATALGLRGARTYDDLFEAIGSRDLLLVLDNCEHLAGVAADLAGALVRRCPLARIVATSRSPLGLEGEAILRLAPLRAEDSHVLFSQRARASGIREPLPRREVASLCHRLDHLPLAIELAAARLRLMPMGALAGQLEASLTELEDPRRSKDPRQRTLMATVAWSYDLLPPEPQRVLRRLSLFAAPFSIVAAEQVAATDRNTVWELVDQSLLVSEEPPEAPHRLRMLEAVREFAARALEADEKEAGQARAALLRWSVEYAEQAERDYLGRHRRRALDRIAADFENLLSVAAGEGDALLRLRLAVSLAPFALESLRHVEVGNSLVRATEAAEAPPGLLARARLAQARMLALTPRVGEAGALLRQAAHELEAAGEGGSAAEALGDLAYRMLSSGEAAAAHELLRDATGRADSPRSRCHVLSNAAAVARVEGRLEDAAVHLQELLDIARSEQLELMLLVGLTASSEVAMLLGDTRLAAVQAREALGLCHPADRRARAYMAYVLGRSAATENRLAAAHEHLQQLVPDSLADMTPMMVASGLENLARVWSRAGEMEPAALVLGAADRMRRHDDRPVQWDDREVIEEARGNLLSGLRPTRVDELIRRGAAMDGAALRPLVRAVGERLRSRSGAM